MRSCPSRALYETGGRTSSTARVMKLPYSWWASSCTYGLTYFKMTSLHRPGPAAFKSFPFYSRTGQALSDFTTPADCKGQSPRAAPSEVVNRLGLLNLIYTLGVTRKSIRWQTVSENGGVTKFNGAVYCRRVKGRVQMTRALCHGLERIPSAPDSTWGESASMGGGPIFKTGDAHPDRISTSISCKAQIHLNFLPL